MRRAVTLLLFCSLIPGWAVARTWHILPDGTGDATTIQAGIDSSVHHDTVLVAPGTYYEAIEYNGKKITVGSHFMTTQDTTWITQTVIDGSSEGQSVVSFKDDEEPSAILCGLTIANGRGTWHGYVWGGGIFCYRTSPTLRHLIIRDCPAWRSERVRRRHRCSGRQTAHRSGARRGKRRHRGGWDPVRGVGDAPDDPQHGHHR